MDKKTKKEMWRTLPYRYRARAPIFKAIFYFGGAILMFIVMLVVFSFVEEGIRFLKGFLSI